MVIRTIALFCCCLLPLAPTQAQSGAAVGMVLDAEGGVEIEGPDGRRPARLAELLYAGNRLTTGSGRATVLYCPSNQKLQLMPGSVVEMGADGFNVVGGPSPSADTAPTCVLPAVALGSESLERIGGLRGRGYPPIALYTGGKVSSTRPALRWRAIEGADSYSLLVRDEAGQTVWEHTTTSTDLPYPAALPALDAGVYRLEVRAESSGRVAGMQVATLRVAPEDGFDPAAGEDDTTRLTRAIQLEHAGYFAEAAHEYRGLPGADNDERILRRLAWLYWNAGLVIAAEEMLGELRDPQ